MQKKQNQKNRNLLRLIDLLEVILELKQVNIMLDKLNKLFVKMIDLFH
jgi:hypothetical protein